MADPEPDINKILANVVVIEVENVSQRSLNSIRKLWFKGALRYGFTPTPDESRRMKAIAENQTYMTFKRIVGKYKFTPYIKLGLLLYELNEKGEKERMDVIRRDVYNSRDGHQAKKIIHIASTGVLLHVLEYLINLKDKQNLSEYAIREEFEQILGLWKKISIPVSNQCSEKQLIDDIKQIIENKEPLIIIYACGHATDKAQLLVAKLIKNNVFSEKYVPWSKNDTIFNIPHYLCICYSLEEGQRGISLAS